VIDRLHIHYELSSEPDESAEQKALGIALEQTVELPLACIDEDIREQMVGRVETLRPLGGGRHAARISYPLGAIGGELTQCLNLLLGNISLKRGIQLNAIDWPQSLLERFGGPAFGVQGLRELCAAPRRALLCTALKPMGLSATDLAARCYQFALGGIDIIKDDHGLANQPSAPFAERLARCQAAVERANRETGGHSRYFPNVTAGYGELDRRLEAARDAGCKGVLMNAWLTGLDALRHARDGYGLALMAHPAFTGSYFSAQAGLTPALLLGEIFRIAGADASIYPNTGGRFGFTLETCEAINHALRRPLGTLRPALPAPGGGMDVQRAREWIERYGADTILLIGGSLYAQGDLRAAAHALHEAISE
jgi:ribulose-bisphosphate carboxylase large chain